MKAVEAVMYMVFQVIGAILGSVILLSISSRMGLSGYGANSYAEGNLIPAFIAETVFTFIFVLVVLGSTCSKSPAGFAGMAIGLTLILIHIVCIPITGTSVNPARSIGPALTGGGVALTQLWLFIVAPFIGAAISAIVWNYFESKETVVK